MKAQVLIALAAAPFLVSCGSDSGELAEEEPIAPPPLRSSAPRLITPVRQAAPPAPAPTPHPGSSIFRYPDVTKDLPEEKALLSKPISTPATGAVNSNN